MMYNTKLSEIKLPNNIYLTKSHTRFYQRIVKNNNELELPQLMPLISLFAFVLELQVCVESLPFLQRSPQLGCLRRHNAVFSSPLQ